MRAGKRKFCEFCVIESGAQPGGSVVAGGTIGGKSRLNVIGITGPFKIFRVATVTIGWRAFELSADMARGAFEGSVRSGESETREFQVIELGAEPGVYGVAAFAGGGEAE